MVLVWVCGFSSIWVWVPKKGKGIPSKKRDGSSISHLFTGSSGTSSTQKCQFLSLNKDLVPLVLLKLKPGSHEKWGKQLTPETTNPLKKKMNGTLATDFFGVPSVILLEISWGGGGWKLGGSSVDSLQLELMGTQPTRSTFKCWRERVSPKPASSYSFSVREFWMIKGVSPFASV